MGNQILQEVIEELATSERRLIERVADLEADRDSYALLARQALTALHDTMNERDRLKRRNVQLAEELRQIQQVFTSKHLESKAAA